MPRLSIASLCGAAPDVPDAPRCAIRNLSVLSYAQGFTHWHYKAKSLSDLHAPGFWRDVADMAAVGDMINVSAGPAGGCILYVTAIDPEGDGLRCTVMASTSGGGV